jgi:hypothetical protein
MLPFAPNVEQSKCHSDYQGEVIPMKCRACGRVVPPTDRYCAYCGNRLVPLPKPKKKAPQSKVPTWLKWLTSLVCVAIAAIVAIVAVIVLLPEAVNNEPTLDLAIQDIAWSPPNPSAGETVTFTVTIKNQGSGDAGPSTVKYYVDGFYKGDDPISSIPAGGTTTRDFAWNAEPGDHSIRAVVSYNGSVLESDETNNESEILLKIL